MCFRNNLAVLFCLNRMARLTKNAAILNRIISIQPAWNFVVVLLVMISFLVKPIASAQPTPTFLTMAIRTEGGSGFDLGWKFIAVSHSLCARSFDDCVLQASIFACAASFKNLAFSSRWTAWRIASRCST